MSYEGFIQVLCKNGHYHGIDCYELPIFSTEEGQDWYPDQPVWTCPICGSNAFWTNNVDVTNGSFDEDGNRIDGYVEIQKEEISVDEAKLNLVKTLASYLDNRIVVNYIPTYTVNLGLGMRGTVYDDDQKVWMRKGEFVQNKSSVKEEVIEEEVVLDFDEVVEDKTKDCPEEHVFTTEDPDEYLPIG